jgi:ABC-2 type transport system permease protein
MTTVSLRSRPEGFHSGSSQQSMMQRVKRIWQYRRILDLLVRRDLKVRYAGSALGYLWTVLDPLLMSFVYWFVFTQVFHRDAGPENRPYLLYLVTGRMLWTWFGSGLPVAAKALKSESQMVRSTNVPRELWLVRTAVSRGVEFVFGIPVIIVFAIAYWKKPTWYAFMAPLGMVMCFFLLLGMSLILAPLTVMMKDLSRLIPIVMRVWFYASPVLYSISKLPHQLRVIFAFNPFVGPLTVIRAAFFPADLRWLYIIDSCISILVIFVIGMIVFARMERKILKEI